MRKEFLNPEIQSLQAIIRDLIPCFIYILVLKSGKLFLFCHGMRNTCIKKRIYRQTDRHTPLYSPCYLAAYNWNKGSDTEKEPDMQRADIWPWINFAYSTVKLEQGKDEDYFSENNFLGRPMEMAGILFEKQISRTS